ncbi:MAG: DeoR/GlpR transcriptional regulator [Chitinophagaceae bacterium]|nr:MAG: DeoR/GlpR transcriptional regulator [Chitinophagaceae bacterium]
MLREERFQFILDALKLKKQIGYEKMAEALNVSEDTIRRDIATLQTMGLLSKVRGGAIPLSRNPLSFQERSAYLTEGKQVIAMKTLPFIKPGATIFLDAGSTICAIAASIPPDYHCRIITHNLAVVPMLKNHKNIELVILGGRYDAVTETNTGLTTAKEAAVYLADIFVMGICAMHPVQGITASLQTDGEIKQAMLHAARQTIAVSNSQKLNGAAYFRVCAPDMIEALITELPATSNVLDAYRSSGIRLI